jgi:hypothetical protein
MQQQAQIIIALLHHRVKRVPVNDPAIQLRRRKSPSPNLQNAQPGQMACQFSHEFHFMHRIIFAYALVS